jgi:uncharacterized Zn finger protein
VTRGRAYQRQGRVEDLAISADGRLLATVVGGERYVTSVWPKPRKSAAGALESKCSCPVGHDGCKHAVAVVADYLQLLADQQEPPAAEGDDPRWDQLAGRTAERADEDFDAPDADDGGRSGRRTRSDWDAKIREHIQAKSREELAELVGSLVERFPELREEFRERIALQEGDADRLIVQARRELRSVTAEDGWRHHWSDEGHTPDYSRLCHRLERLAELGCADAVVDLGRELIERGMEQVGRSHDEGETGIALGECLPAVFEAVTRSSLSGPQRLLFALDACLQDDYGLLDDVAATILDGDFPPDDWSAVADVLARRLTAMPAGGGDAWHRNYERDRVTGLLADALQRAGRGEELLAIYEREARLTGGYERVVAHLTRLRRYDDAERWAAEGIAQTREKLPGVAWHLADALAGIARRRRRWAVVAAHAAGRFFSDPGVETFREMLAAAARAKCRDAVRAAALRFLETGELPAGLGGPAKPGRTQARTARWPLPTPDWLVPLLRPDSRSRRPARPRHDVLIELAIAEQRPDDALRWFDGAHAAAEGSGARWTRTHSAEFADRVAGAVVASHPERALEIYRRVLDASLGPASRSAYESAVGILRKMRPIFRTLGREAEWTQLLSDTRRGYRRRRRFIELLDTLDGRTILQAKRARGQRA